MQRCKVKYFSPELCTFQHVDCYRSEFLDNWSQVLHFRDILHKQDLVRNGKVRCLFSVWVFVGLRAYSMSSKIGCALSYC